MEQPTISATVEDISEWYRGEVENSQFWAFVPHPDHWLESFS